MFKFAVIFLSMLCLRAHCQESWAINPDHSEIKFKVPFMKVSEVTGRFLSFKGEVELKDGQVSNGEVIIEAKSVFTGNRLRDDHLRQPTFFHVGKYPYIKFILSKIQGQKAVGYLVIKEIKKLIKLDINFSDILKDTWEYPSRYLSFKTQIDRLDWKLDWNKTLKNGLLVGNQIEVFGVIQLQKKNDLTPSSKHKLPDSKNLRIREKAKRGELELQKTEDIKSIPDYKKRKLHKTWDNKVNFPLKEEKQSLSSRLLFLFLSFLAFLGGVLSFLKLKDTMSNKDKDEYDDNNTKGFLSDMLGIVLIFAISYAIFELAQRFNLF